MVGQARILALLLLLAAPLAFAGGLPAELAGDVGRIVADAEAAGLPGGRIRTKAREGFAKGVPAAKILAALRAMFMRMQRAAQVLEKIEDRTLSARQRKQLVSRMEPAFEVGMTDEMLDQLARAALRRADGPQALQGALVAFSDLAMRDFPRAETHQALQLAVEKGVKPSQFTELSREVGRMGAHEDRHEMLARFRRRIRIKEKASSIQKNNQKEKVGGGPPPWAGHGRKKEPNGKQKGKSKK